MPQVLVDPKKIDNSAIEFVPLPVYRQIAIRVARTYLQSFVSFLPAVGLGAAEAVGVEIPFTNFLDLVIKSASLSVAPAVIALVHNVIELLGHWDSVKIRA